MLYKKPVAFREALQSREVKRALPNDLSAEQIQDLGASLTERALVSAKVQHSGYLQRADDLFRRIVSPETVDGRAAKPGEYMDQPTARLQLKEFLRAIGYEPDPGKRGGLQDLSSDPRLNVFIKTNVDMARWFGRDLQGRDPAILDQWPAQELTRFEQRREKRDWRSVWVREGGKTFPGGPAEFGGVRLIALKDDSIWTRISDFGLPYPPFAFGSGMGVMDVARDEAEALGLIDRDRHVAPDDRGFNDGLEASADRFSSALQAALARDPRLELVGGVLRLKEA